MGSGGGEDPVSMRGACLCLSTGEVGPLKCYYY